MTNKEVANASYVFVPLNTGILGGGVHWVLALINFKSKEIYIINSLHDIQIPTHNIVTLRRYPLLISVSSQTNIDIDDYNLVIGQDIPQQTSSVNDCGVAVIKNALSPVDGSDFIGGVQLHRFWKTLLKQLGKFNPHNNSEQINKTITRDELKTLKTNYSTHFPKYSKVCLNISVKPINHILHNLKHDTRELGYNNCTHYENLECIGTREDQQILCSQCRNWFHVICEKNKAQSKNINTDLYERFYKCTNCNYAKQTTNP